MEENQLDQINATLDRIESKLKSITEVIDQIMIELEIDKKTESNK